MDEWVANFKPIKSKKDAWQLVYNIGVETRSLSSFYQCFKSISIEGYAKNRISIRNLDKILATLHIQDNILSAKLKEARKLMETTFVVGIH